MSVGTPLEKRVNEYTDHWPESPAWIRMTGGVNTHRALKRTRCSADDHLSCVESGREYARKACPRCEGELVFYAHSRRLETAMTS